ncbi:HHE domain-containing protein [Xylariaceae sp. FL0255]|nr:HHE domain-containing protein [Xylariaceae sp. FL0255]
MTTISEAIVKDHRELEDYYNEVISTSDHDHQDRYGNMFIWELARHSVGEELVVYPAFEKYLGPKGKEMAESDRKEHRQVKEMLKEFQKMRSDQPEYVPKLKELWSVLSHHIRDEESHDLPALEDALAPDKSFSHAIATSFGRTKAFVPTRSHPSAGEHPPFETAMGLLAAPIDRVADIFRKFPDKPE